MKINQLFSKSIPDELALRVMSCFGLSNFDDRHEFCKAQLISLGTPQKLTQLVPELSEYYMPCKAKKYLTNIDSSRSITLLKQIMRLFGYSVNSSERNIKRRKVMFYKLEGQLVTECKRMTLVATPNVVTFV